jgi:hypothetical protein
MRKPQIICTIFLSLTVLVLWLFPLLWYTKPSPDKAYVWLEEQTEIDGWEYNDVPVAKAAESLLVADDLENGTFTNRTGAIVRVFSAKRYTENQNQIGLFVHTPDRCWTEAGWKLEPVTPQVIELEVHDVRMQFERRIFHANGQAELVYFCGLVGGQPVPYRLDHNLSVGMKYQFAEKDAQTGTALRATDNRLWTRVWESFLSRSPLLGPKQFIRISTPVQGDSLQEADRRLERFLPKWLKPIEYERGEFVKSNK